MIPETIQALVRNLQEQPLDTRVSRETELIYRAAIATYDQIVTPGQTPNIMGPSNQEAVRGMLSDVPRTICILRAALHAIRELKAGGKSQGIKFVEAGCGSGFIAAITRLLDPSVKMTAIDHLPECIAATQAFSRGLGLDFRYIQANMADINDIAADVLIAEHLTPGGQREPAALIPRKFRVDPKFAIPYAVEPVVVWGFQIDHDPSKPSETRVVQGRQIQESLGHPIILADKRDPVDPCGLFYVEGEVHLPFGAHFPLAAINIHWGHHGDLRQQWSSALLDDLEKDPWKNHLLRLTAIPVTGLAGADRLWMLAVQARRGATVPFELSYLLGTLTRRLPFTSMLTGGVPGQSTPMAISLANGVLLQNDPDLLSAILSQGPQ